MILVTTHAALASLEHVAGIRASRIADAVHNTERHLLIGRAANILRSAVNVDTPSRADVAAILRIPSESTVATAEKSFLRAFPNIARDDTAATIAHAGVQHPDSVPDILVEPQHAIGAVLHVVSIPASRLEHLLSAKSKRADLVRRHIVVALSALSGLSPAEIATRVGTSTFNVRYALRKADAAPELTHAVLALVAKRAAEAM